jgi:hypothetical protein
MKYSISSALFVLLAACDGEATWQQSAAEFIEGGCFEEEYADAGFSGGDCNVVRFSRVGAGKGDEVEINLADKTIQGLAGGWEGQCWYHFELAPTPLTNEQFEGLQAALDNVALGRLSEDECTALYAELDTRAEVDATILNIGNSRFATDSCFTIQSHEEAFELAFSIFSAAATQTYNVQEVEGEPARPAEEGECSVELN